MFKYEGTLAELEGRTKNTPAAKEASREISAGLKETREAQCLSALFCDRDGVVLIAYLAERKVDVKANVKAIQLPLTKAALLARAKVREAAAWRSRC